MDSIEQVSVYPLTPARWADFESLFGPRGAYGGCWCMWWRLKSTEFEQRQGEGCRQDMLALVASGAVPGLLAYVQDQPAGWCSIAPRPAFPRLARSRVLKAVDDRPVWSVVCFFIAKDQRRQGLSVALLRAAVEYASRQGAQIVEGYPKDPGEVKTPDAAVFTGLYSAFLQAGFQEVMRRSDTRPIMRYFIPAK